MRQGLVFALMSGAVSACSLAPADRSQPAVTETGLAPGQQQLVHHTSTMPYRPCPPTLPPGCEMAVLEGDPRGAGLFTLRIRANRPFVLPPHTHPRAERVTVIEGRIHVGFGTAVDKSASTGFDTGDYYVNAPDAVHFVWADSPVTVQITGIGPWEVHPYTE